LTITPEIANGAKLERGKPGSPLAWPKPIPMSSQAGQRKEGSRIDPMPGTDQGAEELAHDARNLLAAMGLYCDLLAQPGVLNRRYAHYAGHLKVVVDSGIALVGRLAGPLSSCSAPSAKAADPRLFAVAPASLTAASPASASSASASLPDAGKPSAGRSGRTPVSDVAFEMERCRGMLSVLLGARTALEIESMPCSGLVRIEPVDLGRILANLVRNAGEAMPLGGRVRITVQRGAGSSFLPPVEPGVLAHVLHEIVPTGIFPRRAPATGEPGRGTGDQPHTETLLLCVQDNGPGIDPATLGRIFDTGFSTRARREAGRDGVDETGPYGAIGSSGSSIKGKQNAPQAGAAGREGLRPPASRGLGLGIVRGLVEAAGGRIRATSRPGSGTRFEMEFPVLRASVNRSAHGAPPTLAVPGPAAPGPVVPGPAMPGPAASGSAMSDNAGAAPQPNPTGATPQGKPQEGSRVQC
jgi:signal transduction histidine kinase